MRTHTAHTHWLSGILLPFEHIANRFAEKQNLNCCTDNIISGRLKTELSYYVNRGRAHVKKVLETRLCFGWESYTSFISLHLFNIIPNSFSWATDWRLVCSVRSMSCLNFSTSFRTFRILFYVLKTPAVLPADTALRLPRPFNNEIRKHFTFREDNSIKNYWEHYFTALSRDWSIDCFFGCTAEIA